MDEAENGSQHALRPEDVPCVEGLCNAWNPKRQKRCRKPAGSGTDHLGYGQCHMHAGRTESNRKAAQRQIAEAEVARLNLDMTINPHDALLMAVHSAAGLVAYLKSKVAEVGEEGLVWGITREEAQDGGQYPGTKTVREAKPNVWYVMYREAQRDLVTAAAAAAKAGVEERQVRIAEQHAQAFAEAVRGILNELGVADHPEAATVVRKHLLKAGTGGAE